jgi:hypothetical protein
VTTVRAMLGRGPWTYPDGMPLPERPEEPPEPDAVELLAGLAAELDEAQRARLLRAALAMAEAAIAPRLGRLVDHGEQAALAALRAWLAEPSPVTLAGVEAELEAERGSWFADPYLPKVSVVFECLLASVHNDLGYALRTSTRTIAEAARLDPAARLADERRGPLVAETRARRAAQRAQLFAGRLIRAGADPLPPEAPGPMLLAGEDPLEALRGTLSVAECRSAGQLNWLRLRMRDEERAGYLAALRAAVPQAALAEAPGGPSDDDRLPGLVETLLTVHAERALRRWQGMLWVPPFPPLRIPDVPAGPVPTVRDLVAEFEAFTPEGRELVWAYGLRTATEWLSVVRRDTGRYVFAKATDEALSALSRHRPQDPAEAAGCARDLQRALRCIAGERVARWHLDLAAAACEGRDTAGPGPFPAGA